MSLLQLIKHDKEMRRIFGQQELKIMEKQLLGINLSPSEKTRLSRDIRPKFEIIKKISDFKEEFSLKKAQEIKFLIEEAKRVILESLWNKKIKKIFLFGSAAENKLTFLSDVDIAVEFDKIDNKEAIKFRLKIIGDVSDKMDIQVYNILPEKIKKEILNKGRIIYQNEQIK